MNTGAKCPRFLAMTLIGLLRHRCVECAVKRERVCHLVSERKKLAQKEYKRRHDNEARIIHWKLCELHQLERKEKWYVHVPEGVVENDEVKLHWDMNIQCDNVVELRRPDIIVVFKKENKCVIVDIAIPGDSKVHEKEFEKDEKYHDLRWEIRRMSM